MADPLAAADVALVRADNPSPLTLEGTNTWVVGRDPCWVVDPGPDLEGHVAAVLAEGAARGGIAGLAVTHAHADHSGAVHGLVEALGGHDAVDVRAAALGGASIVRDGDRLGPLEAIVLPGHAPDHVCFALGEVCFTGDAVLGAGSVFVAPDPGALAAYLAGLERLRARGFAVLAPGHGPVVTDADERLAGYIAHRLDRERRLVAALDAGARSVDALLDAAWDDVPDALRLPATVTLFAHLDKLAEEGRLPEGVEERPAWFSQLGRHAH
jgi:glyoxylase-like metal-dependent hydrolase (beta-lactamase superfamily II)